MTRPLLLSNGHLHVGINLFGMVHDLYFPHVGHENHAAAKHMRHRIGVWVEDSFSWLDDGDWDFTMAYDPNGMIGHTTAHNSRLKITLQFTDCVDSEWNVFLRNIHVVNGAHKAREIRLFLHQAFLISNSLDRDTAQYLPDESAILHYKGHRAFVAGGKDTAGNPFTQFTVGLFGIEDQAGSYTDAEDGQLEGKVVEFGQLDSVFGFTLHLAALESTRVQYWLTAATTQHEAIKLHHSLQHGDVTARFARTTDYWHKWLQPAEKHIARIPKALRTQFRNSLLLVKAAIDHQGGIVASTDTTRLNYMRDVYAYCWPRDGAYALLPLLQLGYKTELRNFFAFSRQGLDPQGFLHQKYQPDGAIGTSWHPYVQQGRVIPPIQEDETAIVGYLFCEYMRIHNDPKVFTEFYDSLLVPICNFMASYIDPQTKLPHATYDLWENKFLTTTYTVALVYRTLITAAALAERHKKHADAIRWQTAADDIKMATHLLYRPALGYFCKGFINSGAHQLQYDDTIDVSSFYGALTFCLFEPDSHEMKTAHATLSQTFGITGDGPTHSSRYVGDDYYMEKGEKIGNPWFIATLWTARFDAAYGNKARARTTIKWVNDVMLSTGVLPEQYFRSNKKFVSMSPLTWSQAEFMSTVLDLMENHEKH